mgnify:FL=1
MENYQKKIDNICSELYTGGGRGQCRDLIKIMLAEDYINPDDALDAIAQILLERKRTINEGYITSIKNCDYFLKEGKPYVCLDKDLKFCIKTKGTPEWNDVSHVLYRMPVQRAHELIHQYENNYE